MSSSSVADAVAATAVLFALIGYALGRLRPSSFRHDCKNLMSQLTPLLPGARPLDQDTAGRRHLP